MLHKYEWGKKKQNNMQSNSIFQWQYCSTSLVPGRGSCGTYAAVLGKQAKGDSWANNLTIHVRMDSARKLKQTYTEILFWLQVQHFSILEASSIDVNKRGNP